MSEVGYVARHKAVNPHRGRRLFAKLATVVVGIAVGGGTLLGGVAPATAASITETQVNNPAPVQGPVEWGQKKGVLFSGTWEQGTVTNFYMGSEYIGGQSAALSGYCRQSGVTSTAAPTTESVYNNAVAAKLNVAILRHGGTPSADAALAWLVHRNTDPNWNTAAGGVQGAFVAFFDESSAFAPYRAQALQWFAEAAGEAGPYTVDPVLTAVNQTGNVAGSLTSASGARVNLGSTVYTMSGPGQYSNGTTTIAGGANSNIPFTVNGNGLVQATETVTGLPGTTMRDFTGAGTQAKLVVNSTGKAQGSSADVEVWMDMQPIATSTAKVYLEKGEKFADKIHVSTTAGKPTSWIRVNGQPIPAVFDNAVYYTPGAAPDTVTIPAGLKAVGAGKATATGYGDYDTVFSPGKDVAQQAGVYTYVVSFTKANQPAALQKYFMGNWAAPFNDKNEKSIVKYTPTPSTKIGQIKDGKLTDNVTMEGAPIDQEIEYAHELYVTTVKPSTTGTVEAPADKQTLKTGSIKRTGNGVFPVEENISDSWDPIVQHWLKNEDPYLCFRDSIAETALSKAWAGAYGLTAECIQMKKPTVETKASPNGTAPVTLRDKGIFGGTIPSGKDVKFESYTDLFKSDDATVGSVQPLCNVALWTSKTMVVTKAGEQFYPGGYLAKDKGTYDFQETASLTYPKDGKLVTVQLAKGECGKNSERVVVTEKGTPPVTEKTTIVKPAASQPIIPAGELATQTTNNAPLITWLLIAFGGLVIFGGAWFIIRRRSTKGANETPISD